MRHWPGYYVLDAAGEPVRVDDVLVWGHWLEAGNRVVARDEVTPDVAVSTVFLGFDHQWDDGGPPVLWETLVFGGALDREMVRYTSRVDALAGHAEMVERVRASFT